MLSGDDHTSNHLNFAADNYIYDHRKYTFPTFNYNYNGSCTYNCNKNYSYNCSGNYDYNYNYNSKYDNTTAKGLR